jgi:hypothetical protein
LFFHAVVPRLAQVSSPPVDIAWRQAISLAEPVLLINIMKNSSKQTTKSTLAGISFAKRAKRLLKELANLPDDAEAGLQSLLTDFPYVLADLPARPVRRETEYEQGENFSYYGNVDDQLSKYRFLVLPLRNRLRALWRAPDKYSRQFGIFRICQDFFLQGNGKMPVGPVDYEWDFLLTGVRPPSRTERLLLQFMELTDYVRFCDSSDCAKPYFIALRRNQKYCSRQCSTDSQREFKRKWWAENGAAWRAARVKAKNKQ